MILSQNNCKQIFREAYENRYTWPKEFNGYKGNCFFKSKNEEFKGFFTVGKDFRPVVKNISNETIEKAISSQLFEVVIHRVRKNFDEIHSKNYFKLETNTKEGIQMLVTGKNEGDKYRVKDKAINMVYRRMHGLIIEIFVEKFIDTKNGLLSHKYSSIQIDQQTLKPKSQKLYYEDEFLNIDGNLWVLGKRTINYLNQFKEQVEDKFIFEELSLLKS
tara:strand:- start:368 stop:1018 length:651 start_codon:yes stop_codon:yes gene_type:complete